MNKPKKLIRSGKWIEKMDSAEIDKIQDKDELNQLYILKIQEELEEVKNSDYKDITEFADLIQVCIDFAKVNGIDASDLRTTLVNKFFEKGDFDNTVLTNLNPNNPSNKIYF